MHRYVFFRTTRFQLRRDHDGVFTSIGLLSLPIVGLVFLLDFVLAKAIGTGMYDLLGRWPFGLLVYALVFLWHYATFVSKNRASRIMREFSEHDPYGDFVGRCIVAAYFGLPVFLYAIAFVTLKD